MVYLSGTATKQFLHFWKEYKSKAIIALIHMNDTSGASNQITLELYRGIPLDESGTGILDETVKWTLNANEKYPFVFVYTKEIHTLSYKGTGTFELNVDFITTEFDDDDELGLIAQIMNEYVDQLNREVLDEFGGTNNE